MDFRMQEAKMKNIKLEIWKSLYEQKLTESLLQLFLYNLILQMIIFI